MKRYIFKVVIEEGNDEFWDDINNRGVSGCEEVTEMLHDALFSMGINPKYEFSNDEIRLEKFEDADV